MRDLGTSTAPHVEPSLEHLEAEEVLTYMVERFHPRLAIACSFQKEASVILDMALKLEPSIRVFTLDTGVLFPETYETWKRVEEHYDIEIEAYRGLSLQDQARRHGEALWLRDPDACCDLRKATPLKRALEDAEGWIAGVRREHSPDRAAAPKLLWDARHGLWKAYPLADWTEREVWGYLMENDVPYNPLHDRGYDSIGCTHCTQPGSGREGRWADSEKNECGIHAGG